MNTCCSFGDTDPDTSGLTPADNPSPGDDSEPTPVSFTEAPLIGIAKALLSNVNNGDGLANPGYAGVSLRGIGTNATLVLVNGKRVVLAGSDNAFDGGDFSIDSGPGSQYHAAIARAPDSGRYLVAWADDRAADTSDDDIYARHLTADANLYGSSFALSDAPGWQGEAAAAEFELQLGAAVAEMPADVPVATHVAAAATEPARWAEALALETVRQTNAYIADNHGEAGMFATLFLGILDPATGRLTYVNGGHEPPLFLQGGQPAAYLKATGLAVGALPDSPYRTESIVFHPGDGLVLYTDGVTDADDEAGVHFSKQRLVSLVSGKSDDARTLLDSVIAALNAHVGTHAPADDVTLLCMRKILW